MHPINYFEYKKLSLFCKFFAFFHEQFTKFHKSQNEFVQMKNLGGFFCVWSLHLINGVNKAREKQF